MNDVIDRLASLRANADSEPLPDVVRRDVLRARAALRQRRANRGAAAVAAAGTVAATAVVAALAAAPSTVPPAAPDLDLVAYTGPQVAGFTVGKVPQRFILQGSTPSTLAVARPGDHSSLDDFRNKLIVTLRSVDQTTIPDGTTVKVNGRAGTLTHRDPDATQLFYSDGTHDIVVQAATPLGLSDAELVEFAASVTVTARAVAGVG